MSDHLARRAARSINDALFESVRHWLNTSYPGCLPESLTMTMRDPRTLKKHCIRFPIVSCHEPNQEDDGLLISGQPSREQNARPIEENVLEAIGTETLHMRQIAERSGYSYGGHLKETVAKLVRDGRLEKTLDGFRSPVLPD